MATALYSNPPLADFVLAEASGQRSRDNVHVRQSGTEVKSGTLLVQDTVGSVTFAMVEGSTGNPTISATSRGAPGSPRPPSRASWPSSAARGSTTFSAA